MDTEGARKRKNNKAKTCPNPVFEDWLIELRDDAVAKDLQSKHIYTKVSKLKKKN